mmetsp:Transcript_32994/g.70305  ORF Transcript_32994/g.70305 Transcript_32994/m.70305 type:complete len:125 (+) Transcript_32994:473-847(+)
MVSAINALSVPPGIAAFDGAPYATIAAPIPNAASGAIVPHSFSLVARLCALTHECGAALGNARNRKGEAQLVVFPVAGLLRLASSIDSVTVGVSPMWEMPSAREDLSCTEMECAVVCASHRSLW